MRPMTLVGFHASHEQISPRQLLSDVQAAEAAGFDAAMCSDHFAPWTSQQGQSGFAWSWLGAALATTNLGFGTVNAPGQRYNPAIIAQAAATLDQMFPGRFWLALGSGQWMNESVTGERWPTKEERNQRLLECADIIRRMHRGETVTHRGMVTVEGAKLWTLPSEPVKLIQPAIGASTAALGARWADGLATINGPLDTVRGVVNSYREAGGDGELILQVHVSWAPTEDEAWGMARDQWRSNVFSSSTAGGLTTHQLEEVGQTTTDEQIGGACLIDADLGRLTARIKEMVDIGFDRVYLHHVGQNQQPWIDAAGEHVVPNLR